MGNQLSTPKRAVLTLAVGTAALGAVWYLVQQQTTEPKLPDEDPLESLAPASNASDPLPCLSNDPSSESQPTAVERSENGSLQARLSDAPPCPEWLGRQEAKELALRDGPKQLTIIQDPEFWALQTNQLKQFMDDVRNTETFRTLLAAPKTEYSPAGSVNMYQICDTFIVPWTKDTGSSVALLANPDGLKAEAMVSHAWAEDCTELLEALESFQKQRGVHDGFSVWLCTCSQYQPRKSLDIEDIGPTIQEQIDVEPFSKVIRSPGVVNGLGLLIIYTSTTNLMERLWCPFEVNEAIGMVQKGQCIKIRATASRKYVQKVIRSYQGNCSELQGEGGFDHYAEENMKVDTHRAKCSSTSDEMMIRERIESTAGGFAQLDRVVQAKQKELIKALVMPRYHVYFSVQANISQENGALFQLNHIKEHFEAALKLVENLCICVSDKDEKKTAHHLNEHGALCMVLFGPGIDHLDQTNFSFKRFLVRCPRVVIICMPIGPKSAAKAALRAGAQAAIWFQFDTSDLAPFKLFFKRVLSPFLEEALQLDSRNSQRTCFKEAKQSIQQLLDAAQRKQPSLEVCQFDIEFDTDLPDESFLLPQELCPPGQAQGCIDVEFQARVKGNFEPTFDNLVLLACDANTLAKAENFLNAGHPQHVYIKLQNNSDAVLSERCRAIAHHLCQKSYRKRHHDAIFQLRTRQEVAVACSELADDGIDGALLWLDITTNEVEWSLLDEVEQEFHKCRALGKVYTVITGTTAHHARVGLYMDACWENFQQEFQEPLECGEDDNEGIEASDLQTNLRLCGIPSADGELTQPSPKELQSVFENANANKDVPACHVRGLLLEDDGAVIVKIQIAGVCFLHKLRDYVLNGKADLYLTANLHGATVKCDKTSFAEDYEKLSLMLDKPTPAQRQVLQEIAESSKVHLKALAGSGKTFVILSVLEDAFQKESDGTVLLVSKTKALVLFVASWLWQRSKPRLRRDRLARLCVMYDPLESGRHSIHLNEKTGMLESQKLAEPANEKHTHVILDEAHHCCSTAGQRDLIMQHASPETKILMCSDLSQAAGGKAAVCEPEGMHQCQLDQVVRNTQRITMASLPFGLECNKPVECISRCAGPPIKTFIFIKERDEDLHERYAAEVMRAIAHLQTDFPRLSLHNRVLIIVPDQIFHESLKQHLQLLLTQNPATHNLVLNTAVEASAVVGKPKSTVNQYLVLDSVEEIDGLERLFAICVGLDAVQSGADAISEVRARLYRGNTRAQLVLLIVNEALAGGFLEFLGLVRSCGTNFDAEKAKQMLNDHALDNVLPDWDTIRGEILALLHDKPQVALTHSQSLPAEELVAFVPDLMLRLDGANKRFVVHMLGMLPLLELAKVVPHLVENLLDNDEDVRMSVIEVMHKLEPQDLVAFAPDLVLRLNDASSEVRCHTLNVLEQLPPAQLMGMMPSLLSKLRDNDAAVRRAALLTMKKLDADSLLTVAPEVALLLADPDEATATALYQVLGCLPPEEVARLVPGIVNKAGKSVEFGQRQSDAFVNLVHGLPQAHLVQVLPTMIAALPNANQAMRVAIMRVIASGVLLPAQLKALFPDSDVTAHSGTTTKLEPKDFVQCDLVLRLDDKTAGIRCCALQLLAALPPNQFMEAVPAIDVKLSDPIGKVRLAALDVLRAVPGDHLSGAPRLMQWVQHTTKLFKEDDSEFQRVRLMALDGLSLDELIKLERDIQKVMLSSDSPPALRCVAVNVVGKFITWSRAVEILGQDRFNSTVHGLVRKFSDTDASVRKAAVEVVGELRSEEFIFELRKVLKDVDGSVRDAAASGIAKFKSMGQSMSQQLFDVDDNSPLARSADALAFMPFTVDFSEAEPPPVVLDASLGDASDGCSDVAELGLRGVSVWHLKHVLLEEVRQTGGTEDSNIYEINSLVIQAKGPNLICPRDGRTGTAYVDAIGDEAAGRANFMLSYSNGYSVGSIVSSLDAYCDKNSLDPRTTYVWICCLCINLHRVKERIARGDFQSVAEFQAEFESRVVGIPHVLSLMSPWHAPIYLWSLWCFFEIFMVLTLQRKEGSGCKLEIIMPPSEEASFIETLLRDFAEIATALSRVNVENADASAAADKVAIVELVQRGMGFSEVNKQVIGALRDWMAATGTAELDRLPRAERGTSLLINQLALLLHDQGKLAEAEQLCREALEARRETLGDRHPDTLTSINQLVLLLQDQGKLAEAEPLCREALKATREMLGDRHPDTLTSIGNLVDLLREAGKVTEAQAALGDLVATAAEVLGERHPLAIGTAAKAARLRHAQSGGAAEGKEALRIAVSRMTEVLGATHFQTCKYNTILEAM